MRRALAGRSSPNSEEVVSFQKLGSRVHGQYYRQKPFLAFTVSGSFSRIIRQSNIMGMCYATGDSCHRITPAPQRLRGKTVESFGLWQTAVAFSA
jgi:hypothetical protein